MRILNVTQSYAPFFEFGGPPEKVRTLAEGLARKGHEVTVLTADWGLEKRLRAMPGESPADASPFGPRRKVNGVTAIYLPSWLHYRALSWNPALGRYLRAKLKEFAVVHIFGLYDLLGPRVAAECLKKQIPYIVEPIGMFVPIVRNIRLKRLYHRIWGREMLAGADAIIATAEQERAELVAGGLPQEKIVLRRNGVETPSRLPERGAFRRILKIEPKDKVILFLGRLSQKKTPDLLLKAFAAVRREAGRESTRLRLVFVGPDESGMKAKLERMTRQLGLAEQVRLCGPLGGEAKWSAYQDADIFVLPSQNENFGNTAAEAAAAGTPVVVTEQCGIAPLLKDVAGLVVRHEEEELARALSLLLKDKELYGKLKAGCAGVAAKLGWEEPVQEMEVIYSGLAGRPRS